MKRRLLLSGFLGFAAAPFAATRRSDLPTIFGGRRLRLQESPIAGFQYHQGEKAWEQLQIGIPLQLRREPDNPYDPRAIEVWAGRYKLGYLPRLDNCAASQLMDDGQKLYARLIVLEASTDPWQRARFQIDVAA